MEGQLRRRKLRTVSYCAYNNIAPAWNPPCEARLRRLTHFMDSYKAVATGRNNLAMSGWAENIPKLPLCITFRSRTRRFLSCKQSLGNLHARCHDFYDPPHPFSKSEIKLNAQYRSGRIVDCPWFSAVKFHDILPFTCKFSVVNAGQVGTNRRPWWPIIWVVFFLFANDEKSVRFSK